MGGWEPAAPRARGRGGGSSPRPRPPPLVLAPMQAPHCQCGGMDGTVPASDSSRVSGAGKAAWRRRCGGLTGRQGGVVFQAGERQEQRPRGGIAQGQFRVLGGPPGTKRHLFAQGNVWRRGCGCAGSPGGEASPRLGATALSLGQIRAPPTRQADQAAARHCLVPECLVWERRAEAY